MNYLKDKEYNIKYATTDGETKEVKFIPEKDMNTPEMIMKLKNDDKDFFKLLEESKERLVEVVDDVIQSNTGFYIGDPCYVLPDEIYDEIWGEEYNFIDGKITVNEFSFLVHGTAYGDGEYFDNIGTSYGVDSGTLSVIPFELIKKPEIMPSEGDYEYGRFVAGTSASLDYNDGIFTFKVNDKEIVIDTDPAYDDYDYEDDYDNEDKDTLYETKTINKLSDIEKMVGNSIVECINNGYANEIYYNELLKNIIKDHPNNEKEITESFNKWISTKSLPEEIKNYIKNFIIDSDGYSNITDFDKLFDYLFDDFSIYFSLEQAYSYWCHIYETYNEDYNEEED